MSSTRQELKRVEAGTVIKIYQSVWRITLWLKMKLEILASSFDEFKFEYLSSKCIKRAINHRFHIRENINKPLGSKFLDFGCGVGGTSILALNDGFEVYGFDIDKKRIFFRKEIKDRYKIRFLLANGEKLPFKDRVFDVVYSCHVLEHISNDFTALNEIYRVLKDDGIFFLSVPNIYNLSTQLKKKLGYKKPFIDPTHLREYDERELRNKLKDCVFHVILLKRSGFLLPFGNVIFNFFIVQFNLGKVKEYLKTKFPLRSGSIDIMATKKLMSDMSIKIEEKALPLPWWLRYNWDDIVDDDLRMRIKEINYIHENEDRDMRKLKVLMTASAPGFGLLNFVVTYSIALKCRGLNVVVISSEKEQEAGLKTKLKQHGIKHYECNHFDGMSPWSIWKGACEINQVLSSEDIDVIHAQGLLHAIKAYLALKLPFHQHKVALVQSVHYYAHGSKYKRWLFLRLAPKLMNLCADFVLPVSEIIGQKLIRHGLSPAKCLPVHNGIDLEEVKRQMSTARDSAELLNLTPRLSGCPVVIYPARLIPRKGHRYYLEAASQVIREFPEAKFIVTGSGPLREKLEQTASDLGIAENVIFTEEVRYDVMPLLLSRADIGAFPSLAELLPIGILDLMAAGKPVVATSVAGIPEMVKDGESGFLVPPRDSEALAERILELLRDPQKAQRMGAMGRKIAEKEFAIDVIAGKMEDVYELARARASGRSMDKKA